MKKKQSISSRRSVNVDNNQINFMADGVPVLSNRYANDNSISKEFDELSLSLDSNDSDDDDEEGEVVTEVPFSIAFIVILSYIFGGAYIFKEFENWPMIKSVYFVIVTLTTMVILTSIIYFMNTLITCFWEHDFLVNLALIYRISASKRHVLISKY